MLWSERWASCIKEGSQTIQEPSKSPRGGTCRVGRTGVQLWPLALIWRGGAGVVVFYLVGPKSVAHLENMSLPLTVSDMKSSSAFIGTSTKTFSFDHGGLIAYRAQDGTGKETWSIAWETRSLNFFPNARFERQGVVQ